MNKNELKLVGLKEEEVAHIKGWDFSHIQDKYEEGNDLPWDYDKTAATEGYLPNVELCREKLLPLGIDFKACSDPSQIPFKGETFDIILNRHGEFNAKELYRLLKKRGFLLLNRSDVIMIEIWLSGFFQIYRSRFHTLI